MAQVLGTFGGLRVICPHCGEEVDAEDLEIAIIVTGVDCMVLKDESRNDYGCDVCGKGFVIFAECSLDVQKGEEA